MTNLRRIRISYEPSLSAFVREIGMNHAIASPVERQKMVCPEKWRPVIAQALGVAVNDIFDEKGFAI